MNRIKLLQSSRAKRLREDRPSSGNGHSRPVSAVKVRVEDLVIPTYLPAPPDKNPMFLEKRVYQGSSGKVYPLPFTDRIAEFSSVARSAPARDRRRRPRPVIAAPILDSARDPCPILRRSSHRAPALAHIIVGQAADKGCGDRARQQDRPDGLGDDGQGRALQGTRRACGINEIAPGRPA